MKNPWEEIPLADYENHMQSDSVMQLQAMNELMKQQFIACPASHVMILGIAGGNGLEHITDGRFDKVYAVDVNALYLEEVVRRYANLNGVLECLFLDLKEEIAKLPHADMVIANLLIEYIGYQCFQKVIQHVSPAYVSCIIQVNLEDAWISDSPYLHVFDRLDAIHHQMDEQGLKKIMSEINYFPRNSLEYMLPNGKKLVQIDFNRYPSGLPAGCLDR